MVAVGAGVSSAGLRVTRRKDVGRGLWDLFVDGRLAAVNLGFEGREAGPLALEFFGGRRGDVLLDEVSAVADNPLFPDADKDGLPDGWEAQGAAGRPIVNPAVLFQGPRSSTAVPNTTKTRKKVPMSSKFLKPVAITEPRPSEKAKFCWKCGKALPARAPALPGSRAAFA